MASAPKRSVSESPTTSRASAVSAVNSQSSGWETSWTFTRNGSSGKKRSAPACGHIRIRVLFCASFALYALFFAWSFKFSVPFTNCCNDSRGTVSDTHHFLKESFTHLPIQARTVVLVSNSTEMSSFQQQRKKQINDMKKAGIGASGEQRNGQESKPSPGSPYAYTFLLGAIHESQLAYLGFMYNIMISVNILRKLGSTADFVVWAQLSSNSTLDKLPVDVVRLFNAMNVKIRELPKPRADSFAQIVYEKFRPLQMTEYRRVMFLDGDLMPLVNMDYIFRISELGEESILRPNMIFATRGEPANAGWFVLEPREGDFEKLHEIINRQREYGLKLPYPHFSSKVGWGHDFEEEGDYWESIRFNKTEWKFWAVFSDQGLLYYWAKYFKQDTSIVIGSKLQNWRPGPNGKPRLVSQTINAFNTRSPEPIARPRSCEQDDLSMDCVAPYSNWMHFTGKKKPWQLGYKKMQKNPVGKVWFDELAELNVKFDMKLDVESYRGEQSPLGYQANWNDNAMFLKNRTHYGVEVVNAEVGAKDQQLKQQQIEVQPSSNNTVAYAVSLIKCGDFQTHSAGLIDASLVLRHSIHKNSIRYPGSGSRYDYKMYAIVHKQAEACSAVLSSAGFEVRLVDPPVQQSEIRGEYLRKKIHREVCCGADEFVKLYAYTLPEEIVVHVDIDFVFYKPMDHLFDAILYDKDSELGMAARAIIERERPTEKWPDKIDSFITRDWPQVAPNRWAPAFQAGFLVARRDPSVLADVSEIIKEGNYTPGWGWKHGWGNKGYGGYIGAMAMQGVMAYFYDHIRPDTAVELNQCRYNHMGMNVRLHKTDRQGEKGQCRNGSPNNDCEDCMTTDLSKIYSAHFTKCRKPWQCQAVGYSGGKKPDQGRATALDTDLVDVDHCLELHREWHKLRKDLEDLLYMLTLDEKISEGTGGNYRPDVFLGHCSEDGNIGYLPIKGKNETFQRVQELYRTQHFLSATTTIL